MSTQKQLEIQELLNKLKKEAELLDGKALEQKRLAIDALEGLLAKQQEYINNSEEVLSLEKDLAAAQIRTASSLEDLESRRQAQINLLESEVKLAIKRGELEEGILDQIRTQATSISENTKLREAISEQAGEILNNAEELYQVGVAQNKAGRDQKRLLNDIAGSIGFVSMKSNTFLKTMMDVGNGLKTSEDAAKSFAENFKSLFNFTNLVYTMVTKIVEQTTLLVIAADKAQASLAKTTSIGRDLVNVMVETQLAANLFGVSMADAADAVGILQTQTTNFVNISDSSKVAMASQVAMLQKLNVTGKMSAETFQFLNLNLGMTSDQSSNTAANIAMMGDTLGITASKMTQDFNKSLGLLAVYGERSIHVFKGIAAAAKVAGVETETLLSIARKFDTFQGSAEGVAKFNALLGTQLSTTEMLMLKEDERIKMLIEQVQAQGVAFNDMDRFSQKAIAAAAGISDLNEAQRIFGMNMGQFEEYRSQMERSADGTARLKEAVAATMDITTKFKVLAAEFAVAVKPILAGIHDVLDATLEFVDSIDKDTRQAIGAGVVIFGSFTIALKVLVPTILMSVKAFSLLKGVLLGGAAIGGAGLLGAGGAGAAGGGLIGGLVAASPILLKVAAALAAVGAAGAGLAMLSDVFIGADSRALETMNEELKQIGANNDVMVRARATVENLALVTAGRAKDSITGAAVAASAVNVVSSVNNVFEGMKMVLKLDDAGVTTLTGFVEEVASQ